MMPEALKADVSIWVTPNRIRQDAEGRWVVDLEPSDFEGSVTPEQYAKFDALGQDARINVEVKVRGASPVPDGEELYMVMPNNSELGELARYAAPDQVIIKRPRSVPAPGELLAALRRPTDRRAGHEIVPTLSDALLFEKRPFVPEVPRKLQDAIARAHRASKAFVFDRAASYRVGELCAYMADLIADQQEFARCPYPQTFIELECSAFLDGLADAGLKVERDSMRTADEKFGFLITERSIYTAACGPTDTKRHEDRPMWSPIIYRPHQPMTADQEERFCHETGTSRMIIDEFMWGSSYDTLDPTRRRSLRAQNGIDFMVPRQGERARMGNMLRGGGGGDLKVALCASLLLIRPNICSTIETREPGRKLVMGRPTTFLAHRVVTVKLTPDQTVRKIRTACKEEAGRSRARWHEVRGHYCHNHKAKTASCEHDWREAEPLKWECHRGCGGKRAWRAYPNGKGDASLGVVTKHYAVKR
jgi:hypothetical protein